VKRKRPPHSRKGSRNLLYSNMEHPPAESSEKCLKNKNIFGPESLFDDKRGNHDLNPSKRALGRMPPLARPPAKAPAESDCRPSLRRYQTPRDVVMTDTHALPNGSHFGDVGHPRFAERQPTLRRPGKPRMNKCGVPLRKHGCLRSPPGADPSRNTSPYGDHHPPKQRFLPPFMLGSRQPSFRTWSRVTDALNCKICLGQAQLFAVERSFRARMMVKAQLGRMDAPGM
jgi:hypothetical protein